MKKPSKRAALIWIVALAVIVWWLLSSSPASAAAGVAADERPQYGPTSPPQPVHGLVDFEDPTVITSDPEIQAGPSGYYTYRENNDE